MMSREEVEAYLRKTGLQHLVASAVNKTLVSRSEDTVEAMLRALESNHDAEGIQRVEAGVVLVDSKTIGVDVTVSSKLGAGRGVVNLPHSFGPSHVREAGTLAAVQAWTETLSKDLHGFDPVDQARCDERLLCSARGLAAVLHGAKSGSGGAADVAIATALTTAASAAIAKLGARHVKLPVHLHLRCLFLGKNPRAASAALFEGAASAKSADQIDTSVRAPTLALDAIVGGAAVPTSWLHFDAIGVSLDGTGADFRSLCCSAMDVHQSTVATALAKGGVPAGLGASLTLAAATGRPPIPDDALRTLVDGVAASKLASKEESDGISVALCVNVGGSHLYMSPEQIAKERADAEAAALAASAAASKVKGKPGGTPAAKTPAKAAAKDKQAAAAPTTTTLPPWAADPAAVALRGGESEEGASIYDMNMNRVRAAAAALQLDPGLGASAPAPTPASAPVKGKPAAPAAEPVEADAATAKQQISHIRFYYVVQEMLDAYKTSLPAGKRGRDVIVDLYHDTDEAAWNFLGRGVPPADGVSYLSGRFARLLNQRVLDAAVTAVAENNESSFRFTGLADGLTKERDFITTANGGCVSLDWCTTITTMLHAARPFVVASRSLVVCKSAMCSTWEDIEAEFVLATNSNMLVLRGGIADGAAWALETIANKLAAAQTKL